MSPPKTKSSPAKASGVKQNKLPKNVQKLVSHRTTRHLWSKLKRTAAKKKLAADKLIQKRPQFVVKKIGGEKNGGERRVLQKRTSRYYPTEPVFNKRRSGHVTFKSHKRSLKPGKFFYEFLDLVKQIFSLGLEPGRVLIVLAGRHRGKRVVFLKQLASGLLLVNGPFTINKCPLRRMHQQFVIVTSTKLDVSSVKVPEHINDRYFKVKRQQKEKKAGDGANVFAQEKQAWKPDEQRKADQKDMDKQLLQLIRKHSEKKMLMSYLGSYFQLRNRMYPHKMKF
ncbi:60S ribosomal protein L6-like protein [Euroglyphus maynei]|uniref:Large ribosomal subunit protein eL6 n=1 Tax=Euroglyphus maynei TaxID=6958 RepID=A0A1Y3B1P0_EURMA|nr:60S ribosomal protein L6-like protein [Euroglyphus maynei]